MLPPTHLRHALVSKPADAVVGGGTPGFEGRTLAGLRLLDARISDGQGVLLVRYAIAPEAVPLGASA